MCNSFVRRGLLAPFAATGLVIKPIRPLLSRPPMIVLEKIIIQAPMVRTSSPGEPTWRKIEVIELQAAGELLPILIFAGCAGCNRA